MPLLSANWHSRPVFISSTFRDMHAERDWLRSHVFPALEERLRKHFHHLEAIDLRWGVDAPAGHEAGHESVVLTVCLGEIERSRPFLVGLLGDRYGWIPPPEYADSAVTEAGFSGSFKGRSLTDLEIQYGILGPSGGSQRQRSWFYLRAPLPYDDMLPEDAARYSDAHSNEPDAAEKAAKLAALKAALRDVIPDRVRTYSAQWDAAGRRATGLEAWGAQVERDLWRDLDAETAAFASTLPATWQAQDQLALDAFVESRVRGFVGRREITDELKAFATSPVADHATWAVCVTAEAGGGKSSLFGRLLRELTTQPVLVLAHAAGISPQSSQPSRMVRRWVSELSVVVQEADTLDEHTSPDIVDQTFARLLHRAAAIRRVVVLVDALNEFEATVRASHATWIPAVWPANARLIVTATQGVSLQALVNRPGTLQRELPAIARDEAAAIVREICSRYRRTLNARLLGALLDKVRAGGAPSFANPLWLALATEELNLIEAHWFEQVDAPVSDPASGAERITQLLLSVVDKLPPDVEALYDWILDGAERRFGPAWTQSFIFALALARTGWRESDLRQIMPRLSGEAWTDLRFATVRRGFRAHVVQSGGQAQWDLAHSQMRVAVERRIARTPGAGRAIHAMLAEHLLGLPRGDIMHQTETMVHLLHAGDRIRAASYYGEALTADEASGATAAVAALVTDAALVTEAAAATTQIDVIDMVAGLAIQPVGNERRARIGERLIFALDDALSTTTTLDVRGRLLRSAEVAFADLVAAAPSNVFWQRDLAVSYERIGDVLLAEGELPGALDAIRRSLAIRERLGAADPSNAAWRHDVSVCHERIGDVLLAQGDLPGALEAFQLSRAIRERLRKTDSGGTEGPDDCAVCDDRIGDVQLAQGRLAASLESFRRSLTISERRAQAQPGHDTTQRDVAVAHIKIGDLLAVQGDFTGAQDEFGRALTIAERLAAADPSRAEWLRDVATCHNRIGEVLMWRGNLAGAFDAFRHGRATAERLAAVDPRRAEWQHDLLISHASAGDVLVAQGDLPAALDAFRRALVVAEALATSHPTQVRWQRDLSVSHERIGEVFAQQGNLADALKAFQRGLAIAERLAATDPGHADWQRDLSVSHDRIGTILVQQGNLTDALGRFRSSLAIRDRLVRADPANVVWRRDAWVSHAKIGEVLMRQGNLAAALEPFQSGLATTVSWRG